MMNRGVLAAVYSLCIVLGIYVLVNPSLSVQGALGPILVPVYGALILLGGIAALLAIIKPNYKLEMIALWPLIGGFVTYDVALWAINIERHITESTTPLAYGPPLGMAVLSLLLMGKAGFLSRKNKELIRDHDASRLA